MTPVASLNLVGAAGYLLAALLLALLGVLLATTWRGRMQGGLLLAAILITALWAGIGGVQAQWQSLPIGALWASEALRNLGWLWFLLRMLAQLPGGRGPGLRLLGAAVSVGAAALLLPLDDLSRWLSQALHLRMLDLRLLLLVLLALCGLFLVEQLYRTTPWQHRWGIKFLCLGLGGMFAFDFFFFADALLFERIDHALWLTRGPVSVVIVPLLAVSVARNPQWSFDLAVSRTVVYHSTVLAAAGVYLLVMAFAGYYIRYWGGEWSALFQPLFMFGAGLLLFILLFSGQLRARLKLFVSRHFYSYRYDYRTEWLHLISVLSGKVLDATLPERVIFALGQLVESPGGAIWVRGEDGICHFRRCWNLPTSSVDGTSASAELDAALARVEGIIDLDTGVLGDAGAGPVALPPWLAERADLWLLVPLPHDERLQGWVVLARPRAPQQLGWEQLELLGTAARQAASYLALEDAARALAEAEQFKGFNRLSAFVVHDLKNLVAQLSLVTRNAERHRGNPQFVDDALQTVADAVDKMSRLLAQLRGAAPGGRAKAVAIGRLLERVVRGQQGRTPTPQLLDAASDAMVVADADRLAAVMTNIVQNAQDATGRDGRVEVRLRSDETWVEVSVVDTGCGMDETFLRERLFRPFDSTKGLAGMGIGAYECREFVQSLGGRVEVHSKPGQGTSFQLWLPRAGLADGAAADSTPRMLTSTQ